METIHSSKSFLACILLNFSLKTQLSPGLFEGHFRPLAIGSINRLIEYAISITKTSSNHQKNQKSLKLSHI